MRNISDFTGKSFEIVLKNYEQFSNINCKLHLLLLPKNNLFLLRKILVSRQTGIAHPNSLFCAFDLPNRSEFVFINHLKDFVISCPFTFFQDENTNFLVRSLVQILICFNNHSETFDICCPLFNKQ